MAPAHSELAWSVAKGLFTSDAVPRGAMWCRAAPNGAAMHPHTGPTATRPVWSWKNNKNNRAHSVHPKQTLAF